jgi:hypothetical protein
MTSQTKKTPTQAEVRQAALLISDLLTSSMKSESTKSRSFVDDVAVAAGGSDFIFDDNVSDDVSDGTRDTRAAVVVVNMSAKNEK